MPCVANMSFLTLEQVFGRIIKESYSVYRSISMLTGILFARTFRTATRSCFSIAARKNRSLPEHTSLTPSEIVSLLELCLNATYFAFRNTYYQQIHGTAMGSPVSAVAADLVMEDVESKALSTYPQPPKFWKRYVDDTCCALKVRHIDDFHRHINTIEATIQSTVERESDAQLAFLDVLVIQNPDRTLAINVYRKPTHTDRYLDF